MRGFTRKDFLEIIDQILGIKELTIPSDFGMSSLSLSSITAMNFETKFAKILITTFIATQMLAAAKNNFDIKLTEEEKTFYSGITKKVTEIHQNDHEALGSKILQHIHTYLTQQLREYCPIVPVEASSKAQIRALIKRFLNVDTILHPKFPNYLISNEHKLDLLRDTFGMVAIEIQIENRITNLQNNFKTLEVKSLKLC